jgi:hypothetical protein
MVRMLLLLGIDLIRSRILYGAISVSRAVLKITTDVWRGYSPAT